ncbi:Glucokinase [Fundidesulfovibrio magnetotacticus]|uniref:Glucokinase n=2 Tax=Fundidesulfovibrio magnetotacticus TaxID=2730080 RepID=A0A6V8LUL4_9BACT|nr:Glucokinase [Fundidesulfovibrio magnetotacticus]
MHGQTNTFLVADIGGTNARFALFDASGEALALAAQVTLPTRGQEGFASLAGQAVEALDARGAASAVLAAAGPVVRGRFCRAPNIPYLLDLDALPEGLLPARALMVNDFAAQAHGCRILGEERSLGVLPGRMDPGLTQAVLGPGTGLGKAALVPDGRGGYVVCASEGGHALFPCDADEEWRFRAFVLERLGEPHLRREAVVSGPGLALLHQFLTGEALPVHEAAARMTPESPVTRWFARFLGRACRDYVLETAARGGLFVSGGVAARNPLLLEHPAFREEFLASPTMAELLAGVAVRLVTDQAVGLWGAAALARGLAAA